MLASPEAVLLEHLTPHDLVAYFRCPHEMELQRAEHARQRTGVAGPIRTPPDVVPLRHAPLLPPPALGVRVYEGRLDIADGDRLVYQDDGEDDLPMLFPPERIALDPRYSRGHATLVAPALGLAGRPDLVVARGDGRLVPVEYKETHLFVGFHEAHGRLFDSVQAIAECALVQATFGQRPPFGIVLYGDARGGGLHEGWVEVPYDVAEEQWLLSALAGIRADRVRAPVPAERNCRGCGPNRDGLCRYAGARFEREHP
jgi:hypothetical protein